MGHTLEIAEINPQGMDDLYDNNICYLMRAEDIIYILFLENYAYKRLPSPAGALPLISYIISSSVPGAEAGHLP